MQENSLKWLLVLLLTSLVIILIVVLVLLLRGNTNLFSFFHFGGDSQVILEEQYNVEKINRIVVDTAVSDIKFLPSEDNSVKVVIYGEEKDRAESNLEQNVLTISSQKKNRICFGFCFFGKEEIIVYLPENKIKELELKTISGDITITESLEANVKLKTTSGDVVMQDANVAEIKTTSGDIKIGNVKNASLYSTSGEIEANSIEGKASLSTTSGDIKVNTFKCQEDSEIKSVSGDVKLGMVENAYIETKTVSGDSDVANNNRGSKYTLNIKTTSGDIRVN